MGTNAGIIRGRVARYIYVVIAVVFALLLRVALAEHSITLPTYVTFYPVVFLSALLGGISEGIVATALSALLVDYFLLPPVGSFAVHSTSDIVAMVIFCAAGITASVVAGLYQRSRERRAAQAIESAILSERENVEEAGELTETVRAERRRFLGVLETLRTASDSTVSPGVSPIDRIFSTSGGKSRLPTLDQKRFRASLRLTVWVPFLAALILAAAALWAAYNLYASMQRVDRTDQVIGQSRRVLRLLVDMEAGERGYLVTGNVVFLQPYQEGSKSIESEYQKLYLLAADSPPQQALLEKLHANINHWQSYAEQMIALRRAGGAYTDLQANLAGKAEVDEIRDRITEFQSVEEHLRDERTRTARRDWRLVATICILLGLGIGVGLAVFTFRRMEMVAASFEESGRKLAASEQRWATTLESIGDAVLATDNEGRIAFLNPVAAALTGWNADEAQGRPVQEVFRVINEKTQTAAEDIVARVLREGHAAELANHTAMVAKNGVVTPIEDSAAPIRNDAGEVVGVVLVFRDVTVRRRAQQAQQYLSAIVESSDDAIIGKSLDGAITSWNRGATRQYGYTAAETIGKSISMLIPADHPNELQETLQKIAAGEEVDRYESIRQRKDGSLLDVSLTISPIFDATGKIVGASSIARDITEAKRAEIELRAREERLRMATDAAQLGIFEWTVPTDTAVWENKRMYEIFGIPETTDAVNRDRFVSETLHPEDLQRFSRELEEAMQPGALFRGAYRIRRMNDGQWRWIQYFARFELTPDGKPLCLVGVLQDITEARRAEEFRQSSQYTRSLLEASLDPLVTISPDGKITDVNEAAIEVTGVARDRLVGTDFADYFTAPDKAREGYLRVFSEGFVTDYPLTIRHADGRLTEVLYNASVYKDDRNNVLGVFAAARDVTDLKRAEAELAARAQELARSNADLQQFAYVASHDLQEPLRTIGSFSQLLARRYQGKLDADADEFLTFIVDGAMRMQTLINDLLAFSRVGTQGSPFAPTDCEKILHSAEENLKAAIEESGAVITHDPLPRLVADERQLTQLFQNLLSNAIKFRRPEMAPCIHVSSKRQNGAWKLSIRDNGIGIDPHYFDRIFIIFQRLHGREQYTGTGIGLAICKKIVERHGGRLWVESESGTGSTFHFVIPGESNIGEGSLYDESRQRS